MGFKDIRYESKTLYYFQFSHVKMAKNLNVLVLTDKVYLYSHVLFRNQDCYNNEYIILEDLTKKFEKACILDLKMGTRMYKDSASQVKPLLSKINNFVDSFFFSYNFPLFTNLSTLKNNQNFFPIFNVYFLFTVLSF